MRLVTASLLCPLLLLLLLLLLLSGGCKSLQDYQVVPRERADELASRRHVLEGVVTNTTNYFTHWAGSYPATRHDLKISTERVLKGGGLPAAFDIKSLRAPSEAERRLLLSPDPFSGTRFRIGYDERRGDRYTRLQLVPLALTPETEAWIARSNALKAERKNAAQEEKRRDGQSLERSTPRVFPRDVYTMPATQPSVTPADGGSALRYDTTRAATSAPATRQSAPVTWEVRN